MATSTLLQSLNPTADGSGFNTSAKCSVETFYAYDAITAGDWVALVGVAAISGSKAAITGSDASLWVQQAAAVANGNPLVIGVAKTAATAYGQTIQVYVEGVVNDANVDSTAVTAVGKALVVDTTAGRAHDAAASDLTNSCGVTLSVPAGNKAVVLINKAI